MRANYKKWMLLGCLAAAPAGASELKSDVDKELAPMRADLRHDAGRSLYGGAGLLRVRSARVAPRTLSVSAHGGFFHQSNMFAAGDTTKYYQGLLGVAYTPNQWLEASLTNRSATFDRRHIVDARYGIASDLLLRGKGSRAFNEGFVTLGLEAGLRLPPSYAAGLDVGGISPILGMLGTFDFTKRGAPMLVHLNAGFNYDRSRVNEEPGMQPEERLGLQFTRHPQVELGIGVEGRFKLGNVLIHPFLESAMDIPTGVVSGLPSTSLRLTPGLRVLPWRGLFVDVALEASLLRPQDLGVEPAAKFLTHFGMGYQFGWDSVAKQSVDRIVYRYEKAVTRGRVRGLVLDAATGLPVPTTTVILAGRNPIMVDELGSFGDTDLELGTLPIRMEAYGYLPSTSKIDVVDEKVVSLVLSLTPDPTFATIRGVVRGSGNEVIPGKVYASSTTGAVQSDGKGGFVMKAKPGHLVVQATAPGHLRRAHRFTVHAGDTITTEFMLRKTAETPLVNIQGKMVELTTPLAFPREGYTIPESWSPALDELASVMIEDPTMGLRISGHADATGTPSYNRLLSELRARMLVQSLVERGIDSARLNAVGFGDEAPAGPNQTREGRAKNRRVEIVLQPLGGAPAKVTAEAKN